MLQIKLCNQALCSSCEISITQLSVLKFVSYTFLKGFVHFTAKIRPSLDMIEEVLSEVLSTNLNG